jgi:hypothetical protein
MLFGTMNGENQPLVTNEWIQFEKYLVEVQHYKKKLPTVLGEFEKKYTSNL